MINDEQNIQEDMSKKENRTTEKSIKIWSEKTQKWRYVPKDPAYFRLKYYDYVKPKTCDICSCVIHTQMLRHYRTKKCQLVRNGINNAVVKIESAISPFKMEGRGFTSKEDLDRVELRLKADTDTFTVENQNNLTRYLEHSDHNRSRSNSSEGSRTSMF